ncbi:MAG: lysine transporter LysE [Fusobacteriaceae bacterium]|nr:lysine transporter LysE [Fusobacteriaceae bacterium]
MCWLFIKGIITGFILALPFGPVGIYCSEITLSEGQKKGLIAAFGMITIDLFYCTLVLLFMDSVDEFLLKYELYFKFLVGILLILLSIKKIKKKIKLKPLTNTAMGYFKNYSATLFVALSNISSFFSIWLVYTTLRLFANYNRNWAPLVILGVFTGDAGLWILTTSILSHWKKSITEDTLLKVTQILGIVILIFGIIITSMAVKMAIKTKWKAKWPIEKNKIISINHLISPTKIFQRKCSGFFSKT